MSHNVITAVTRGGRAWTPKFVVALDASRCIGCGRCFKVCSRDVFELVDREVEEDEDDGVDDDNTKVMSLADRDDCIGCEACSHVCPKACLEHAPLTA